MAADIYLQQIIKLQKLVVGLRIIIFSKSSEPSATIFQKFELLQIKGIYTYSIGIFMYKHAHLIHPRIPR